MLTLQCTNNSLQYKCARDSYPKESVQKISRTSRIQHNLPTDKKLASLSIVEQFLLAVQIPGPMIHFFRTTIKA